MCDLLIPFRVSVPSRSCLSLWNSVREANCTSSFEKVPSVVCMFRIFLWVFDRVGYCSLHFFSCSPIIGYVDCWRPACFYFSLLLDAHSKLWLSLAEKDFRGCFLPQRHFFFLPWCKSDWFLQPSWLGWCGDWVEGVFDVVMIFVYIYSIYVFYVFFSNLYDIRNYTTGFSFSSPFPFHGVSSFNLLLSYTRSFKDSFWTRKMEQNSFFSPYRVGI